MNKDNAAQYLPFVQALAEGKTIQVFSDGEWLDLTNVLFNAPLENYRIKSESVRMYVVTWFDKYGNPLSSAVCQDKEFLVRNLGEGFDFKLHELDCGETRNATVELK